MASLAEIRARLAATDNKPGSGGSGGDGSIYPHWKMEEGQSALLRFLPDGNTKNTFFWAERQMIRLPFNGVKGEMESKQVQVRVPCVEMWQDTCPVLTEVRTWFKDKSLEDMGRKYWKKRDYVFQGFVRENPLADDTAPTNPIRRFIIGPQIFAIIKGALMDPELEELPTDLLRGLNFTISKTAKGGYADYNTSKWARKESALTEVEQAAIAEHGLYDLSSFLPKRPTDVELKIIKEMFEASVDGQSYDSERWGAYFRPAGVAAPAGSTTTADLDEEAITVAKPTVIAKASGYVAPRSGATSTTVSPFDDGEDDTSTATAPVVTKTALGGTRDILAEIRARQKTQ